ncbi:MAG: ATP-binding protein [Leptospira sp.]|nr:ATP-binding protein [Leptospira sp.]
MSNTVNIFLNSNYALVIYFITTFLIAVIVSLAILRRPLTSTNFAFSIFAFSLLLWNINEALLNLYPENSAKYASFSTIYSTVTFLLLVVLSLNFPYYGRRDVIVGLYVSFLAGIGFSLITITLCDYYLEGFHVLTGKFTYYATYVFIFLCMCSALYIISYKINKSLYKLRKFFANMLLVVSITLALVLFINVYIYPGYFSRRDGVSVAVFNIFFFVTVSYFLVHFRFWEFYPGVFAALMLKEWPRMLVEIVAPATVDGCRYLKQELWKEYKNRQWVFFLEEFWFNIIIDETLDNAIEHGGQRMMDDITVQVFETEVFLDLFVIDKGKGFDPKEVPDPSLEERKSVPSGRGIHIMKKLFDVSWNFLGNEIRVRVSKDPDKNPKTTLLE